MEYSNRFVNSGPDFQSPGNDWEVSEFCIVCCCFPLFQAAWNAVDAIGHFDQPADAAQHLQRRGTAETTFRR